MSDLIESQIETILNNSYLINPFNEINGITLDKQQQMFRKLITNCYPCILSKIHTSMIPSVIMDRCNDDFIKRLFPTDNTCESKVYYHIKNYIGDIDNVAETTILAYLGLICSNNAKLANLTEYIKDYYDLKFTDTDETKASNRFICNTIRIYRFIVNCTNYGYSVDFSYPIDQLIKNGSEFSTKFKEPFTSVASTMLFQQNKTVEDLINQFKHQYMMYGILGFPAVIVALQIAYIRYIHEITRDVTDGKAKIDFIYLAHIFFYNPQICGIPSIPLVKESDSKKEGSRVMENENNMDALQSDHVDPSNDSDIIEDALNRSESEINHKAKELLAESYALWHYPTPFNTNNSNEILLKIIEKAMESTLSKIKIPLVIPQNSPAIERCLKSIRNKKIDELFPNKEVSDFENKIFSDLLLSRNLVVEPSPSKAMVAVICANYYDGIEEESSKRFKEKFARDVFNIYKDICKMITEKQPILPPLSPLRFVNFKSRFFTFMNMLKHDNDHYTVASVVNVFKNNLNHLNKEYPYIPVLIVALNLAYLNHIRLYLQKYQSNRYIIDLEDVCKCFYTFEDNERVPVCHDKIIEELNAVIKEGPSSSGNAASFKNIDDDNIKEESTMGFYYGLGVGKIDFDLIRFDFEGNILFRNDTSGDFKRYDREKKILVNMGDVAISTKHTIAYAIPVQINTIKENDVIIIKKDSGVSFGIVQFQLVSDENKLKVIDVDNNVREIIFDSLFGTDLVMVSKVFTLMDLFKTNQNNMLPMLLMSKEKGEDSMDTKTMMLMMMMNNNNGGNNNMNNMLPLLLMDDDTCDMEDIILMSMLQNQNSDTAK